MGTKLAMSVHWGIFPGGARKEDDVHQSRRGFGEGGRGALRRWIALLLAATLAGLSGAAQAQEIRFFRIGTGATGETHFPLGGLIANAISNPPGSRECAKGGSCGVPGLIAVAVSTHGAVANIQALGEGRLDAALAQADIAYWAFHGTGIYKGKGAVENLRAIAMLYPDSIHLVARRDAGISGIKDLKGKRVSLGEKGSGTLVEASIILEAHGVKAAQLKPFHLRSGAAADALAAGEIDAFFVTDAGPVPAVADLARKLEIDLVPIEGPQAEKLRATYPFFLPGSIAAGTYRGQETAVATLNVGVVLLVRAEVDAELVYGITRALWHPSTQKLLTQGHPRGNLIRLEAATERMGIQLHAGAASYYFDAGLVN